MKTFTIAGRLGADPELQEKDGKSWTRLRIAANGRVTDWFTLACFGPLAENVTKKLGKGDGIAVRGELRTQEYEGKEQIQLIGLEADFFPKG